MPSRLRKFFRFLVVLGFLPGHAFLSTLPLTAAEPTADAASSNAVQSAGTQQKVKRGFTARDKNRSGTTRDWSPSVGRTDLVSSTTSTEPTQDSRIRFASASGMDDGEVPSKASSDADSTALQIPQETNPAPATPSLSVKEQLLNALRAQREATSSTTTSPAATSIPDTASTDHPALPDHAASPPKPGTLTILNSPHTKSDRVAESVQTPMTAPMDALRATNGELPHDSHSDPTTSDMSTPQNSDTAKSPVGLTRTLEADLHSDDAFVRERAQRYLRLEMQLLKLRASQAAAAELPAAELPAAAAVPHVPEAVVHTQPNHADHANHADNATSMAPPATTDSHDDPHGVGHSDSPTDAVSVTNAAILEHTVVDGPIDRLGLANNLFAVGQYPLALEMYQQASAEILSAHQKFWIEYQTANCIRRSGRPGEASNRYRRLADQPEAGWISTQAQWWVETLEKIRVLESFLVDNSIDRHRANVEATEKATLSDEDSTTPAATAQSLSKEPHHDAHAH